MPELEHNDKYGDRRVLVSSPFLERIKGAWFHHKGKIIVSFILAIILFVTLMQNVGRKNYSVMVAYGGPSYLSTEDIAEIENVFSTVLQNHVERDKALVGVAQYSIYSKAQIESIRSETDVDGTPLFVNSELNSENYGALYEYIMTGDTALLLLDSWLYEELLRNERLLPMSELFDTTPPSVDKKGYGIVLGETDLYGRYDVLKKLPAETVLCCLKPYVFGNTSNKSTYELMKDTVRAIAGFGAS